MFTVDRDRLRKFIRDAAFLSDARIAASERFAELKRELSQLESASRRGDAVAARTALKLRSVFAAESAALAHATDASNLANTLARACRAHAGGA